MPKKSYLLVAAFLVLFAAQGPCQLVPQFNPMQGPCCKNRLAQQVAERIDDWDQLARYHAGDVRLEAEPVPPGRVVFMGDSITDFWKLDQYFPGKPYVNRGISGQITSQMLVRMFPDVIDLHPAAMIVLAGTNDVAGNFGPETATMVEENLQAMAELARNHGIKVIICSLTPVSDYTAHPQTPRRPPANILELNRWIHAYTAKSGAGFADYYAAVVDSKGMFREGYSRDGLHPNAKGYELLAPVAEAAIEKALGAR